MIGPTIAEMDKMYLQTLQVQRKKKNPDAVYNCPFSFYEYNSTDGTLVKNSSDCGTGKGPWCKICSRHTKSQAQLVSSKEVYERKKKHVLDSYKKTGLVPHMRRDFYSDKKKV